MQIFKPVKSGSLGTARGIEVKERAAEGLQYGEVIANEG